MDLHIVPPYAAVLALIFVLLSIYVIRGRGRYQITIGSGAARTWNAASGFTPTLPNMFRSHYCSL